MRVLYVACNPDEASELAIEREITELQRSALAGGTTSDVSFLFMPDVSVERLPLELSRYRPDIVHFSAHGTKSGLEFSEQSGENVKLTAKALKQFFNYEKPPRLVYFNACDSANLARDVLGPVQMAIGTTAPITNKASRESAVLFYDRLLMGMSVHDAFSAGKQMIESLPSKARVTSVLRTLPGVHATSTLFHKVPKIVAWPADNRLRFNKWDCINVEVKLVGSPAGTSQVVFFTDDKRFLFTAPKRQESDAAYLARHLCQVVRDTPRGGILETDDSWPAPEDFRIFACGTTGDGQIFTVQTLISDAMSEYATKVLNWSESRKENELAPILRRLRDPLGYVEVKTIKATPPVPKKASKTAAAPRPAAPKKAGSASKPVAPGRRKPKEMKPAHRHRVVKAAKKGDA